MNVVSDLYIIPDKTTSYNKISGKLGWKISGGEVLDLCIFISQLIALDP